MGASGQAAGDYAGGMAGVESSGVVERLFALLRAGDVRALARAVSLVEDGAAEAGALLELCRGAHHGALRVGVTGPPGVGKSTLVDALTREIRRTGRTVGILAVDPSSVFTGGALLGDRIRMGEAGDPGVYMRSMAARGHLGGLARTTEDVLTVMEAAGKDVLLIETTGVGQGEIEVAWLAGVVLVVLAPGMGDGVQALKAGVLEIASVYVLNKADLEGVERLEQEMRGMLELSMETAGRAVVKTVAISGEGVVELLGVVDGLAEEQASGTQAPGHPGALLPGLKARATSPRPAAGSGFSVDGGFGRTNVVSSAIPQGLKPGPLVSDLDGAAQTAPFQCTRNLVSSSNGPVLDHLGIAVRSIAQAAGVYEALGMRVSGVEEVQGERVRVAMVALGESRIELLEATEEDSAVGRFLAKRGEGLHHIALRVPDLSAAVEALKARGVRMVSERIVVGAGGHRYVFVHPTGVNGVLLELVEEAGG